MIRLTLCYLVSSTVKVPLGWISTLLPQNLILGWIDPWKRKASGDSAWKAETGGWWLTCSQMILSFSTGNQYVHKNLSGRGTKEKALNQPTWNRIAPVGTFHQEEDWMAFLVGASWKPSRWQQMLQRTVDLYNSDAIWIIAMGHEKLFKFNIHLHSLNRISLLWCAMQ